MSDITDTISQNLDSRNISPKAVVSQVALMSAVSVGTVIVFNILRPNNKVIYEPKVKYHEGDKIPPRISSGIFGWVSPLLHTKEDELVDKIGLDAATFLRFLRMMRWIFTGIAITTCAILLPINITYNLRSVKSSERDVLSMLTIRNVGGYWLFAHVAMVYVITLTVFAGIWIHWRAMVRLRRAFFRSPEYVQSFYARTLAVTQVPKKYQSDEGVRALFESINAPYPTTSVHIGRRVGILPALIDHHNDTVRKFEQVLVHYLKGGRIRKDRPTIRIGGFLGMGGKKLDAIDYYTQKLKETEAKVEAYRAQMDTRKPENYGFASMAAVPYAHIVATQLRRKKAKGAIIQLAPNPKDIIWENMNRTPGAIASRRTMGWFWLSVVSFLNTIPLFVVSIVANLTSIAQYVGFLEKWQSASPNSFAFVSGVAPAAISALFGFFLPRTMRAISEYQGALTHSRLDRAIVARYYAFLVISQLIIFTLIGVGFQAVSQIVSEIGKHQSFQTIIDSLDTLPATINATYIDQSSYWLTFFPLRGFLVIFDLAQILNLLWISFKTHVLGRTPRDHREYTRPQDFEYATYYANLMFMGTVGLAFAPLAPLVAVAAAIVFWMSSWVYKYQLMFVFITRVETGGRLWNPVVNRLLFSLMIMHALMVLTIGLQYGWKSYAWVATIPPFIMVVLFKMYINKVFHHRFRYYTPTEDELRVAKIHSERADIKGNRLEKRFGHPALHAELFTPMLHANMMPLLAEVYHGKIAQPGKTKLDEYGGQELNAQVMPGGLRIAAVSQGDLEYDPALFRRDRGELDWDQRSIATTAVLGKGGDNASLYTTKQPFGRDQYLAHGPGASEIELARFDNDKVPLLPPTLAYNQSSASLPGYPPSRMGTPTPRLDPDELAPPPAPYNGVHQAYASQSSVDLSGGYQQYPPGVYQPPYEREAPMHRPQGAYSPQGSYNPQPQRAYSPAPPPQEPSDGNMAGRGARNMYRA